MNQKFWELNQEKQDKIMNAAFQIFSETSYKKASTDDIVKLASISKGLLYHYFKTKAHCYQFLFRYASRYISNNLNMLLSDLGEDNFHNVYLYELQRIETLKNYPAIYRFLDMVQIETSMEVLAGMEIGIEEYKDKEKQYRESLRMESEKIGNILRFTLDGLEEKHLREGTLGEPSHIDEVRDYIASIKHMSSAYLDL